VSLSAGQPGGNVAASHLKRFRGTGTLLNPDIHHSAETHAKMLLQSDWPRNIIVVSIFVFGIAFLFGTRGSIFGDGDVSWHIAAGQWMIAHHAIPYADPFSYTFLGKPWVAHEWLSEIVMALVFDGFGYTGIATLIALALAFTFLIIALRLQRWMSPVEMCAALMVIALALYPLMLARPMVLAWPLLALWTTSLLRAREEERQPSWYLIPLMALWANMHATFSLGLGLAALFGLEALLESRDRGSTFIEWVRFGAVCGLAGIANPHGIYGVLFPLGIAASPWVNSIAEFHPTAFSNFPTFELMVMAMIGVGLLRGARLAPVRLAIVLILLHLAMTHIRHQSLFVIVSSLVALPAMTQAWIANEQRNIPLAVQLRTHLGSNRIAFGTLTTLLVVACGFRLLLPVKPPNSAVNAVRAFDMIPQELRKERVLNEYSFGGPLILRGIKVFMDGRADLYGEEFFARYLDIEHGEPKAFAEMERRWNFCWTIFRPDDREILNLLDGSPSWRRIYADKYAVIHVRRPCGHYR
jgi:hypothetical protein